MSGKAHFLTAEVIMVTSFQDADPMGVVYHGNYFRFFEEARRVLMNKLNYGYREMQESGFIWPIIETHVKYVRPIPFNHEIQVVATLKEWENRLRVDYVITDARSGERLTKAYTMQVAVRADDGEMCLASPAVFTDKVEAWYANAVSAA
ncbi:acyl-CoA thioesterase [Photobacterium lutimaris]|uniref:4-hydroxybenzoyl-CoA thioesterase n=1 Tax=Photobacterium lutimaris TaxID=388278 RepID=A0A2T3J3B6_9GAMM|nr:acyl-CoA thioesterase [Photobacterium lutimaris]PSU35789.1 4-hydroxybenzoyl-CoA thioesterase [Photobacterium lutimaris]TDR78860.1 acyl-CoA thioester hydrolase [Photobacterium lutimaris]